LFFRVKPPYSSFPNSLFFPVYHLLYFTKEKLIFFQLVLFEKDACQAYKDMLNIIVYHFIRFTVSKCFYYYTSLKDNQFLPPGLWNIGCLKPGRPKWKPGPGDGQGCKCGGQAVGGVDVTNVGDEVELAAAAAAAAMATIPARNGGCRRTGEAVLNASSPSWSTSARLMSSSLLLLRCEDRRWEFSSISDDVSSTSTDSSLSTPFSSSLSTSSSTSFWTTTTCFRDNNESTLNDNLDLFDEELFVGDVVDEEIRSVGVFIFADENVRKSPPLLSGKAIIQTKLFSDKKSFTRIRTNTNKSLGKKQQCFCPGVLSTLEGKFKHFFKDCSLIFFLLFCFQMEASTKTIFPLVNRLGRILLYRILLEK